MEYRQFGRTGMRVSVLGLGCGGFGGVGSAPELFGKGEDQATAFALMDHALDAGINYFDTADSYGGGASEQMIGAWLKERKVRDRIVLSTKVFYAIAEGPNERSLSRRQSGGDRRQPPPPADRPCRPVRDMEPDPATPEEETLQTIERPDTGRKGTSHRGQQHPGQQVAGGAGSEASGCASIATSRSRTVTACWSVRSKQTSCRWRSAKSSPSPLQPDRGRVADGQVSIR